MAFRDIIHRIVDPVAIVIDEMGDLAVVLGVLGVIGVSALIYFAF
jgi:hypothetical protein